MRRAIQFLAVLCALVGHARSAEPVRHWAFSSPRRPPLPAVADREWPINAIDYFVLAQMEAHGLAPAPRTERATLLRRATLDLTGLPPSLSEMDAASLTPGPDFHEQLVARLIASPRYGERMAVPWLDAARYADTHGFLIDAHRDMWRWRDWVIEAFNRNLPFNEFTIEQLAGDLLDAPTTDQLVATGFNRNHMINYENGAEEEEYRVEYVADRAATTASVWLGLTFQCARCHDHKYDPLSSREYFQWFAFFNHVPELGLDGNLGNALPVVAAPTAEQARRGAQLESQVSLNEAALSGKVAEALREIATWEPTLATGRAAAKEPRDIVVRAGFDRADQLAVNADDVSVDCTVHGIVTLAGGRRDQALLLDGHTFVDLDGIRWPAADGGITLAAWVYPTTADEMGLASLFDTRRKPRLELRLVELRPALYLGVGGAEPTRVSRGDGTFQQRQWQHLAVCWDGTASGEVLWFRNGVLLATADARQLPERPTTFSGKWRLGSDGGSLGFRGMLDEVLIFPRVLASSEIAALANADPVQAILSIPTDQRSVDQTRALCTEHLRRADPEFTRLEAERDGRKRELSDLRRSLPTSMVMRDSAADRPTFVLRHGKWDQHGEQVEPGTPAILPAFPDPVPRNRLGLARWLVQPSHPLTSRVAVNRLWQSFFGDGLVRTPEDFGLRGEPPSHPELLDWLAVELIESGWDVKHIVHLIVTSATYRQSSRLDRELLDRDPENRWLARAPRLRMEAETLRDSQLFLGELLDPRIGGPSVFPYQPPGLWEEVSFNPNDFTAQRYFPSRGADLYRRGVYTFWKRTQPPPAMLVFDAPTRETCVASRGRSNTPLQGLVLMNEPTCLEAARHLAARGMREPSTNAEAKAAFLFRAAASRPATLGEQRELAGLYARQLARFQSDPPAALRLLAIGDSPRDERLDAVQHAAWMVVANAILCLDETITRN